MVSTLRGWMRRWLHTAVLATGFRLERVKPFEAQLLRHMQTVPDFWFVQVGAYNGITSDPFCKYLIDGLWQGVLVEPQRRYWEILKEIYQDRPGIACVNVAIGDIDGHKPLYRVADAASGLPYWASQLASFHRDVVAGHRDRIPSIEQWIVTEDTACCKLSTVVREQRLPRVDLLAIDVEGADFEVLKQIDDLQEFPKFVFYEHLHLSEQDRQASWQFLRDRGYKLSFFNDGDTFGKR